MNTVFSTVKFAVKHTILFAAYVLVLWLVISQYFAFMWVQRNSDSFSHLFYGVQKKETTVSMTADELITSIAKTAMAEAKK